MDLKIKDVVELLKVSETTIRRWLAEGKIPAYRINQQYRFNREEIEDWVINRKNEKAEEAKLFEEKAKESSGNQHFSLYRAIHKGNVFSDIIGTSKEEVIKNTMVKISVDMNVDAEVVSDLLLDREKQQPTSLNHGIGIPHTRDFLLSSPFDIVTVVFPEKPLEYGAMDGLPVQTLFFLFASNDKRHLHLLAKIAHLSSHEVHREFLQSKPSKEALLVYIKNWESSISL
jgi:nitrogen PTS system EIIA component